MKKLTLLTRFIVLITLLALLFSSCSNSSNNTMPATSPETTAPSTAQFDITEYKQLVSACADQLSDGAIALSNVVKYEYNYWKSINNLGGTFKPDQAVTAAMAWIEENSDYTEDGIKDQHDSIALMYKEIISIDIEGTEAQIIFEHFDELFDAYIGLYNMGMSPSGSLTSFVADYNTYTNVVKSSKEKLDILLA